ncbi:hypothetical protein GCM10017784_34850 [Deinococcus indicus]|uniref:hypothetical protein n=1 Tax=Deinococcus indicus TaxID=223556 RepID=UPI00174D984A|nr:hypothetical protein [Deinococcus indicus]GHG37504.1 hypothetical protein GCM10017784_34850 [Deinococcus indicus]
MDDLHPEMQALQSEFQAALTQDAGFLYPYRLTPAPGTPFWGNVWSADPKGRQFAQAVQAVPDLAQSDVRFLTVRPGDEPPGRLSVIPFGGGLLTVHWWAQTDALSGETVAACEWTP